MHSKHPLPLQQKSNTFSSHHQHRHEHVSCNGKSFEELCIEALKGANYRITQARLSVIECLSQHNMPLSPTEIYDKLTEKGDKIDKVSVYRVLESLAQLKLIHQILPSGDYLRCDTACETKSSHLILKCNGCNLVKEVDLGLELIETMIQKVSADHRFQAKKHTLQFDGFCENCLS
ncbi:MAG: transcriptional repressor [Silvanigrellaceae bacterium]|nr:transcriptional repressor [Silvanigrellaceae bacterium]